MNIGFARLKHRKSAVVNLASNDQSQRKKMLQNTNKQSAYPYYLPRLASSKGGREWQCRCRRTDLFSATTGLQAVKVHTKSRLAEIERVERHMHLDHISAWNSPSGALFILNEPYRYSDAEILSLHQVGYEARIVPPKLAPYNGRFNAAEGAQPGTTSILITASRYADELELIYQDLLKATLTAPDWNT